MATLEQNVTELSILLGRGFVFGKGNAQHPLRKCIATILQYHKLGDVYGRDSENARLSLLIKNVKEIRGHSEEMFRHFKTRLKTSDYATGTRMSSSVL